jgi:uncharacterized repeat protein (TIGR03803 family)
MRPKKPFSADKPTFMNFITLLLVLAVVPTLAHAQTFKVLHTFHGKDGSFPTGALVRDSEGNLYGTTSGGGSGGCGKYGCGTVFKMNSLGKEFWLYSFKGANEIDPSAGLFRDASGNLYGTTEFGGKITKTCGGLQVGGCGTVFKVDKTGNGTVLYKFKGTPDGYFPAALLVEDVAGNLYGTTSSGGAHGLGAVFEREKSGKETVLYSFSGGSDGCFPEAGVILDAAGNLYGVTHQGGVAFCNSGYGVVFKLDITGKETVLHSFAGYPSDGANPASVLLLDSGGNLYGTTQNGGSSGVCDGGCGTVFELSPQNGNWSETVLYSFCSLENCSDGEEPGTGPLARNASGDLYGTTTFGGTSRCNGSGCGVVFALNSTGKETVLHSFTGGADGMFPVAGLFLGDSGTLYGTAWQGGATCFTSYSCGVVFKIAP